ncbi:MAG: hypothetical protein IJD98_05550 [Oscillospiraceae bacterium]|nr:hypothetical protein [Oscillospiraceae bacterium]
MKSKDFEWLTDEFMLYCRSTQLREKTMSSYEQTLHLFGRWLADELKIYTVDKIKENRTARSSVFLIPLNFLDSYDTIILPNQFDNEKVEVPPQGYYSFFHINKSNLLKTQIPFLWL